jgi:formylglycine-generating enzyme required for sulfatase activity
MAQVFISYSRKDLPFVEQLAADLEKAGLEVWYDLSDLEGGVRWRVEIEKAIRNSQFVIVVLSPDSVESEWVEREFLFASNLGRKIVPLLYRPCELPLNYLDLNYIDAQGEKYAQNFGELLQALSVDTAAIIFPSSKAKKPSFKLKTEYVIAVIGASVVIIGVLLGPPLIEKWFAPATEIFNPHSDSSDYVDSRGIPMRFVKEGAFTMGSEGTDADQMPVHAVYLDSFYIDKFEVTNKLYKACVDAGICDAPKYESSYSRPLYYGNSQFENYPVIYVDWNMAKTYCEWRGAELPTEAQWEKTARGTDGRKFPWGNDFECGLGNFDDEIQMDSIVVPGGPNCDGYADTAPAGSYDASKNSYGVHDMAGNVWEWVSSLYLPYPYSPTDGREDLNIIGSRVLRGGSWVNLDSGATSANRNSLDPSVYDNSVGLRCARLVP